MRSEDTEPTKVVPIPRITLPRTPFLYVVVVLLLVFPTIGMVVISPYSWSGLWCEQFELPEYEKALGFRLGRFSIFGEPGGTYEVTGFTWIDRASPLAAAGLRQGDVPRMHHGFSDLCTAFATAKGDASTLRVANVRQVRRGGGWEWRDVVLRLPQVDE